MNKKTEKKKAKISRLKIWGIESRWGPVSFLQKSTIRDGEKY